MHILTLGDKTKPVVLMLSGTLCSGRGMKALGSRLAPGYMHCGYQVCAPDAYMKDLRALL